jgi:hypothetical protein
VRMSQRSILLCFAAVLALPMCALAKQISIDTGECSREVASGETVVKSDVYSNKKRTMRAYGAIAYRRSVDDAKPTRCHVEFRIFISFDGSPFRIVKSRISEAELGEIAGIDLVGESPDGSKFAADTWLAEGDGEEHWPIVYDLTTGQARDHSLGDKIQSRIHGCDQNEDFVGVTNAGEALFAIPPSEYDNSSGCGDKGLWRFSLVTGKVMQIAKNSGDKWK